MTDNNTIIHDLFHTLRRVDDCFSVSCGLHLYVSLGWLCGCPVSQKTFVISCPQNAGDVRYRQLLIVIGSLLCVFFSECPSERMLRQEIDRHIWIERERVWMSVEMRERERESCDSSVRRQVVFYLCQHHDVLEISSSLNMSRYVHRITLCVCVSQWFTCQCSFEMHIF